MSCDSQTDERREKGIGDQQVGLNEQRCYLLNSVLQDPSEQKCFMLKLPRLH